MLMLNIKHLLTLEYEKILYTVDTTKLYENDQTFFAWQFEDYMEYFEGLTYYPLLSWKRSFGHVVVLFLRRLHLLEVMIKMKKMLQ